MKKIMIEKKLQTKEKKKSHGVTFIFEAWRCGVRPETNVDKKNVSEKKEKNLILSALHS